MGWFLTRPSAVPRPTSKGADVWALSRHWSSSKHLTIYQGTLAVGSGLSVTALEVV